MADFPPPRFFEAYTDEGKLTHGHKERTLIFAVGTWLLKKRTRETRARKSAFEL